MDESRREETKANYDLTKIEALINE